MRRKRGDILAITIIMVALVAGLGASWLRWGNPLVDCGREMNQPLRLARGEMLYSQVRHIYGPLSPYLNAGLFRIGGSSLGVLYAEGIICTIVILLVVYWLSRQLMGRLASATATLSVMWLCAFKPAGNYILPYSYAALHGCLFGLLAIAGIVLLVKQGKWWQALGAGVACGLTILAKTEMGGAAMIAGLAGSMMAGLPGRGRAIRLMAWFSVPAMVIAAGAYSWVALRTGWEVLARDSFLFFKHLPPELVYFNMRMSGLDHPALSLAQIGEAALRYAALAVIIASLGVVITREKRPKAFHSKYRPLLQRLLPVAGRTEMAGAGHASPAQVYMLLGVSMLAFLVSTLAGPKQWDTGPYIAMPLLLGYLLAVSGKRYLRAQVPGKHLQIVIGMSIYALASLSRIILRVRSGGAYSSYLLPASIILFTYCWIRVFPSILSGWRARLMCRRITVGVLLADVALTGILISYRYRINDTYSIRTARGTILTQPELGRAFDEAIGFISSHTDEGEPVAVLPEGTSLDFFTDRRNPLREEIVTPGFLDREGEQRAMRQLSESGTNLILIANRPTPEFGSTLFGVDYCQDLVDWITANYELGAVLGLNHDPIQQVGDKTFFIKAYLRKDRLLAKR